MESSDEDDRLWAVYDRDDWHQLIIPRRESDGKMEHVTVSNVKPSYIAAIQAPCVLVLQGDLREFRERFAVENEQPDGSGFFQIQAHSDGRVDEFLVQGVVSVRENSESYTAFCLGTGAVSPASVAHAIRMDALLHTGIYPEHKFKMYYEQDFHVPLMRRVRDFIVHGKAVHEDFELEDDARLATDYDTIIVRRQQFGRRDLGKEDVSKYIKRLFHLPGEGLGIEESRIKIFQSPLVRRVDKFAVVVKGLNEDCNLFFCACENKNGEPCLPGNAQARCDACSTALEASKNTVRVLLFEVGYLEDGMIFARVELVKEDEDNSNHGACSICMAKPALYAFISCGHACCCAIHAYLSAAESPFSCPICMEGIEDVLKIYINKPAPAAKHLPDPGTDAEIRSQSDGRASGSGGPRESGSKRART